MRGRYVDYATTLEYDLRAFGGQPLRIPRRSPRRTRQRKTLSAIGVRPMD